MLDEILPACSEAVSERRDQQVTIIDLDGLRMGDALDSGVQELLKDMIKIDSDNYPEMSGKMFIVNAPFLFKSVWGVISSFMDARTRSKITMCSSNYKSALLECINEEAKLNSNLTSCPSQH